MKNFVVYLIFIFLFSATKVEAQTISESEGYKKIAAGKEYKRSGLYKFLWGTNYRKEWITPVLLPVLNLDTLKGGILSLEAGGSHQTRSLHIKLADKKEYTLRSVNKSLAIIPDIFKKTFIEHIANDQISMSHPYGALGVAIMAESANLPHTNPKYFYLPEQKSIDTLSKKFADEVYLFEERPKGDWSSADNLDNFNKFINTEKLLENI